MVLGIDPGVSGGAVLLDRHRIVAWWAWSEMKRRKDKQPLPSAWRLRASSSQHAELDSVWSAAYSIVCEARSMWLRAPVLHPPSPEEVAPLRVAIEGLFVGQRNGRLRVQDVLRLAETVGEIRAAVLSRLGTLPIARPPSRDWRPAAGIPAHTKRAEAEARAIEIAEAELHWPETTTPRTKAERGAVCEAALIARYLHAR